VSAVLAAALALLALLPVWVPLAVVADLMQGRFRLPLLRMLFFALGWAWFESACVVLTAGLWLVGQRNNRAVHYRLQAWWAATVLGMFRAASGIKISADDVGVLRPGPVVLLCRHASLADSLVSAWVVTSLAGMRPRYVLKRELLADPCLDIVGNRLPNHFLDRDAVDTKGELDALKALAAGMSDDDVAVIFPEGTRASPAKRKRALDKLAERDPDRAQQLAGLEHLLPPRPSGSAALLAGAPDADVVVAWHVGFDGLDTFGGILRHVARRPMPVRFRARRFARADVPVDGAFTSWLDAVWLQADRDVHAMIEEVTT